MENVIVTKTPEGEYQFDTGPDDDNHMLSMKVTSEGVALEVVDSDGGTHGTASLNWDLLLDITEGGRNYDIVFEGDSNGGE